MDDSTTNNKYSDNHKKRDLLKIIFKNKLSFFLGSICTLIILLTFYYSIIIPKQQTALYKIVEELNNSLSSLNEKNSNNTTSLTPTPPPEKTNSTYRESQEIMIDKPQWVHLTSNLVGVSFDYPIPWSGKIEFIYATFEGYGSDPRGQSYDWELKIIDRDASDNGYSYSFAGGISATFTAGRSSWFTDFYELTPNHYIDARKVFKTKYNTDAVFKVTPFSSGPSDPEDKGVTIFANLPIKNDIRFKGIAIYVRDGLTDADALKIVNSLTVE